MSSFTQKLDEDFRRAFPDDFIEEAMRLFASEYRTAHEECATFYPYWEAHDLYPHARRAKIEHKIRDLANTYPEMAASPEPNATGTSFHTRILSHNVILTVNYVTQPTDMVRWAEFRNTYARAAQGNLFEEDAPPAPDAPLYAIWLHGASKKNPKRPDFMHIVFPDDECEVYVHRINLFAIPRFRALANELWPVRVETVEDDLMLGLRSDAKQKRKKTQDRD